MPKLPIMWPGNPEIESDPSELVVKTCCCPVGWPLTVMVCWSEPGSIVTVIVLLPFPLSDKISVDVLARSAKTWNYLCNNLLTLFRDEGLTIGHFLLQLLRRAFLKVSQFQMSSQVARLSDGSWANRTCSRLFWLWFRFWLWKIKEC